MNEMRAAPYDAYGPPEVLQVRTAPVPRLRPGHVLVRVAASSVNG
jgi:NADPH:quinone reductase-like Zn-dependent oxidoreductase